MCDDCGLKVNNMANFKRHIKTHNREQIIDSEICEKKIARKSFSSILLKDLETNTVAVPKICDTSENKLGRSRTMRTSSNEKSFSCPRCEHTFLKECEFLEHMKIHTVMLLKCGLCESVFQRQSNLTVHLRSHTSQNITSLQSKSELQSGPESETESEAAQNELEQHNEPIEHEQTTSEIKPNPEHAEKSAPKESSQVNSFLYRLMQILGF